MLYSIVKRPHQESNPDHKCRKLLSYPLDHKGISPWFVRRSLRHSIFHETVGNVNISVLIDPMEPLCIIQYLYSSICIQEKLPFATKFVRKIQNFQIRFPLFCLHDQCFPGRIPVRQQVVPGLPDL